ncbi:MAG: hypothetical protein JWR50_3986 [Mucilaginibacter sp.]|nr:hypothetical protein [Mucilaginibacter sp.]
MKKILFLIPAFLFAYQLSNAQTQKETQTLGLYLGYINNSNSITAADPANNLPVTQDSKNTQVNIGPSYGYFISDRSELGVNLSYAHTKNYNAYSNNNGTNNSYDQTNDSYGGSIYFKKYVLFQNKFGFRTGPYANYQHGINKYGSTPDPNLNAYNNNTSNSYGAGGTFELVYYPSKKMGIAANVANLNYTHVIAKGDVNYKGKQDNFAFNFINNGLYLSIFYVIGGM